MPRKIIAFTQPVLPCEAVERFLNHRRAKYEERSVANNEDAVRELKERYNGGSMPTVIIGEEVLVGFDPERLDQLIGQ